MAMVYRIASAKFVVLWGDRPQLVLRLKEVMKLTKPKLIPVLLCFTVVGLCAAVLPYPGLENALSWMWPDASTK